MSTTATSIDLSAVPWQAPFARRTLFDTFIRRHIRSGCLTLVHPDGRHARYGDGSGPEIVVALARGVAMRLMLSPSLAFGESYMDGGLRLLAGSIHDLVNLIGNNFKDVPVAQPSILQTIRSGLQRRWLHINGRRIWAVEGLARASGAQERPAKQRAPISLATTS